MRDGPGAHDPCDTPIPNPSVALVHPNCTN